METKKVLLIEDEQVLADVLDAKLQKAGYETIVAYEGEDGLNKIRSWQPDLILLDIVLPKINGYEVLETMQAEGNKTPVIIISNSGQPVEIDRTKQLGAIDFLVKTQFDPDELIEKVNNYLQGNAEPSEATPENPTPPPAELPIAPVPPIEAPSTASSAVVEAPPVGEVNQPIPASVMQPEATAAVLAEVTPGKEGNGKIKILLVEDDKFLRDICGTKLLKEGFQVIEAIDGGEVLGKIEKENPNIVLLDIVLPSANGFEILSQIKKHADPRVAKTIVLMLSNLGQEDDVKKAIELGASDYLIKSNFTTEEITEKIKKTLKI